MCVYVTLSATTHWGFLEEVDDSTEDLQVAMSHLILILGSKLNALQEQYRPNPEGIWAIKNWN